MVTWCRDKDAEQRAGRLTAWHICSSHQQAITPHPEPPTVLATAQCDDLGPAREAVEDAWALSYSKFSLFRAWVKNQIKMMQTYVFQFRICLIFLLPKIEILTLMSLECDNDVIFRTGSGKIWETFCSGVSKFWDVPFSMHMQKLRAMGPHRGLSSRCARAPTPPMVM